MKEWIKGGIIFIIFGALIAIPFIYFLAGIHRLYFVQYLVIMFLSGAVSFKLFSNKIEGYNTYSKKYAFIGFFLGLSLLIALCLYLIINPWVIIMIVNGGFLTPIVTMFIGAIIGFIRDKAQTSTQKPR